MKTGEEEKRRDAAKAASDSRPVAWVVGGTSGFGRVLAGAVARRGFDVVVMGRDAQRLQDAVDELKHLHTEASVRGVSVDILDLAVARETLQDQFQRDGRLDLLINCVGKSCRVAIEDATPEMYGEWMQVNFQASVNASMIALPWLIQSRGGLINIGSQASRVPWPWIGPYAASKRALASFTDSLRIELGGRVRVLLVCPGPIARADAGTRYLAADVESADETGNSLSGQAHKPGAGAPLRSLDPEELAGRILKAWESGKGELLIPGKTRWLMIAYAISTRLGDWLLRRVSPK